MADLFSKLGWGKIISGRLRTNFSVGNNSNSKVKIGNETIFCITFALFQCRIIAHCECRAGTKNVLLPIMSFLLFVATMTFCCPLWAFVANYELLLPIMSFWLFVATQLRGCPWVSWSCQENERNAKTKWLLLLLAMHWPYLIFVILRPGNLTQKAHTFAIIIASKKSLSRFLWKFLHWLERFKTTSSSNRYQLCHCQYCLAATLFHRTSSQASKLR